MSRAKKKLLSLYEFLSYFPLMKFLTDLVYKYNKYISR